MTLKKFDPIKTVLPEAQKTVWKKLPPVTDLGFVLYGGTAIALQLGHRQSVDFDFFTEKKIDTNEIFRNLPFLKNGDVLQSSKDTLTIAHGTKEGMVKLSFFGEIGFGRVGHPMVARDTWIPVASLDDLMATKLKVILQRAEKKDYIDIAEMIRSGVSLQKGVASATALYGKQFPQRDCLAALSYFKDGDLDTLSAKDKNLLTERAREVKEILPAKVLSNSLGGPAGLGR
jgi:hypothetical protein